MTRDDIQRALTAVLLSHSPEDRAQQWERTNDEGVPLWVAAVAFVSTARFYDHAFSNGFTKTSDQCQAYVEHLSNRYGAPPVGRWVQNGTVVVWAWKTRDGVKRVGFCSAPDYPTLQAEEAPAAKVWLWRQLSTQEIGEADLCPTLNERAEIVCLRHGRPMDECNCMTYPQAALAQGKPELAREFKDFDWASGPKPEPPAEPSAVELDAAKENMKAMLANLQAPIVVFCPCGVEIQPNSEQLCQACSLAAGAQPCDFCGKPPTMGDPLVNHDRDHRLHRSCAATGGLNNAEDGRVRCPACSTGDLPDVYHQPPVCRGGSSLADEDDPVLATAHDTPLTPAKRLELLGAEANDLADEIEQATAELGPLDREWHCDSCGVVEAVGANGGEDSYAIGAFEACVHCASGTARVRLVSVKEISITSSPLVEAVRAGFDANGEVISSDPAAHHWLEDELHPVDSPEAHAASLLALAKQVGPESPIAKSVIEHLDPSPDPTPAACEESVGAPSSPASAESLTPAPPDDPEQDPEPVPAEDADKVLNECRRLDMTHPIGTPVLYWPGVYEGDGRLGRTRSHSWDLCGTAVVKVEGFAGGIAWSHIEVISEPEYRRCADTPTRCGKPHPETGVPCEEKPDHSLWTHGHEDPTDPTKRISWPLEEGERKIDIGSADQTPYAKSEVLAEKLANESPEALTTYATVLYDEGDLVDDCGEVQFCSLCAFSIPKREACWRQESTMGPGGYLWGHDECVLKELQQSSHQLTEIEIKLFGQRREARKKAALPTPIKTMLVTPGMQAEAERAGQIEWARQADLDNVAKQRKAKTYAACRICRKSLKPGDLWLRRKSKSARQRAHQPCVLAALEEAERGQEATS